MKTPLIRFALVMAAAAIFCATESTGILPPLCIFKAVFGVECPGCGTTRALWAILRFDIGAALGYNKLIVITFPLMVYCTISWIFSKRNVDAVDAA